MEKYTLIKELKVSGHNYWSGRGEYSYARPEYLVGYYINEFFKCVYAVEYDKSSMNKAKELANKYFDELEREGGVYVREEHFQIAGDK